MIASVTLLAQILVRANEVRAEGKELPFRQIIVEDLSLQAEAATLQWDAEAHAAWRKQQKKNPSARMDQHYQWRLLAEYLLRLRSLLRAIGLPYYITAHVREPSINKDTNEAIRGGPRMPSKNRTEDIPAVCSTVLRCVQDYSLPTRWKWAYECNPNSMSYISGDRNDTAPPRGPQNAAELLRANGHVIRRLPGLEWQDDVADAVADFMATEDETNPLSAAKAVAPTWEHLDADPRKRRLKWALRDGMARGEYRQFSGNPLAEFGIGDDGRGSELF